MERKIINILDNPESGTSGISSALQLTESTSSIAVEFGTLPSPVITIPSEEKPEVESEETFKEIIHRIIRRHKEVLNRLDEF